MLFLLWRLTFILNQAYDSGESVYESAALYTY